MPHYGLLRDYRSQHLNTEHDIRGATVYGRTDERLGKIAAVIFDDTGRAKYVVVETSAPFSHKKFLVPAYRLHTSPAHEHDVSVNLDKHQVEGFPHYQEAHLASRESWGEHARRWDEVWHSGPQRQEGLNHAKAQAPEKIAQQPGTLRGRPGTEPES